MPSIPMFRALIVSFVLMAGCQNFPRVDAFARLPDRAEIAKRLPPGVKLDTVADCEFGGANKRTVEDELIRVKAHLGSDGKLQDGLGKSIEFFSLTGCWGNPPANYQEIISDQNRRLQELRKTHTVITLTCNPTGMPIP